MLPAIYCRFLPVAGTVNGKEAVAGVVVAEELIVLAGRLQRLFQLVNVGGRGTGVVVPEQPKHRAIQAGGVVHRGNRLPRAFQFSVGHGSYTTAPAVDRRVNAIQSASNQINLATTGAETNDPNLVVMVRQGAQVIPRSRHVAQGAVVGHTAGFADAGAVGYRITLALPEMQVGGDAGNPVIGQLSGHFLGSFIPTGHMVNQYHAGEGAGAKGASQVSVNQVAIVSSNVDRFRNQTFIRHKYPSKI